MIISFEDPALNAVYNPTFIATQQESFSGGGLNYNSVWFRIDLSQPLPQSENILISFVSNAIYNSYPYYVSMVKKTTTEIFGLPICSPQVNVLDGSTCLPCHTLALYTTNSPQCPDETTIKLYSYTVESDLTETDTDLETFGIFKITGYDYPNLTPIDQTWMQTNINLDLTSLTALSPVFTVTSIPTVNTAILEIKFKVTLTDPLNTILTADELVDVTLNDNLMFENAATPIYVSLFVQTAEQFAIKYFAPPAPPSSSTPSTPSPNSPNSDDRLSDFIRQKPENLNTKVINSTASKTVYVFVTGASILIGTAGAFSAGCINFASAFIKLF